MADNVTEFPGSSQLDRVGAEFVKLEFSLARLRDMVRDMGVAFDDHDECYEDVSRALQFYLFMARLHADPQSIVHMPGWKEAAKQK